MGPQMRKVPALLILSVSSVQQAPKAYHHDRWIKQDFKAEAWRQVSDVPQMPKGPHDQRPGTRKPVLALPDHSPWVEGSVPGITQKERHTHKSSLLPGCPDVAWRLWGATGAGLAAVL